MRFSNGCIRIATAQDIASIESLLNSAYRGEASKQGWTTEAYLIEGEVRTTHEQIQSVIKQKDSTFLLYINEDIIMGCVNLQKKNTKMYLGMFAVSPLLQGRGIGKELMKAAEEYALAQSCFSIYMQVIDVRYELIDWYIRHGYSDTCERKIFNEDGVTGRHKQVLQFMILEKELKS